MQRALIGVVAAAALLGAPGPARALEASEVAALAERHYRLLYGFSALEAYQAQRGRESSEFVVARRWRGDGVDVVVDVIQPEAAEKWAFLFLQHLGRPDDFFGYVPVGFVSSVGGAGRRVRRFEASYQESDLPFIHTPLRELRPLRPGELEYTYAGDLEIEGELCHLIRAQPHPETQLSGIELAISPRYGISLRTRFLRDGREVRHVVVSPADIRIEEGRALLTKRRLVSTAAAKETVLVLRNFLLDPELPDRLFSAQTLRTQRFPSF
jgi:hypothetical protein